MKTLASWLCFYLIAISLINSLDISKAVLMKKKIALSFLRLFL